MIGKVQSECQISQRERSYTIPIKKILEEILVLSSDEENIRKSSPRVEKFRGAALIQSILWQMFRIDSDSFGLNIRIRSTRKAMRNTYGNIFIN